MTRKICPFMSCTGVNNQIAVGACPKKDCRLWIEMYTTEGLEVQDCALVLLAKKDSEGKIRV